MEKFKHNFEPKEKEEEFFEPQYHVDKVVGEVPEPRKENEEELLEQLFTMGGEKIKEYEIGKTPRDLEIIQFASKSADAYMKKYGRKRKIDISLNNVHVLRDGSTEKFTKGRLYGAAHSLKWGSMTIDRTPSDVQFVLMAFHEFIHFKSYKALQVTTNRKLEDYRSGFMVTSRDGKETYFKDLEEALTALVERRFWKEVVLQNPLFESEVRMLKEKGEEPPLGYGKEREKLDQLIDRLFEANKEIFRGKEEIENLFIEAHTTGKLLKVARLIEKTFGKGSFRALGEETGEKIEEKKQE